MSASCALSALVAGLATGDCALPGTDCDGNGLQDACEMANNPLLDCDANLILDVCDLQDAGLDLDGNGILDVCDCGIVGKPLPHPGPIVGEAFGRNVDIEGPRIVVGARDSDAVYVFRNEGDNWVFESELVSEDQNGDGQPDIQGFFLGWGQTVRIAGDSIAVGARLYNIPGTPPQFNAGILVTFRLTDAGWVEDERLQPPGIAEADAFSQAMDFEQTTLITSSPGADDAGNGAGELHWFERDLYDGWEWRMDYRPDDLQPFDRFGAAIAVEGNELVVSSSRSDDLGTDTGSIYLLQRTPAGFVVQDKFFSPEPFDFQEYGGSLDFEGDIVAVGASFDDQLGPDRGMVGIHERDANGDWNVTVIRPSDLEDYQLFGGSVSLAGDYLVVGAPSVWSDPTIDPPSGKMYIYKRESLGNWVEVRRFFMTSFEDSTLGLSVSVDGDTIVSGALFDDRYGEDAGIARVFDLFPAVDCDGDGICDLPQQYDPAFDCDGNGVIDSCEGYTEEDCDSNGVPDDCELTDNDCNGNGRLDACDIADGAVDKGCDGILDVCQCPADLNNSGVVSFEDLLILVSTWGACLPECPTDLDCDGEVGMSDILELLNAWGQCG